MRRALTVIPVLAVIVLAGWLATDAAGTGAAAAEPPLPGGVRVFVTFKPSAEHQATGDLHDSEDNLVQTPGGRLRHH